MIKEEELQALEDVVLAAQRLVKVQKGTMAYFSPSGQALVASLNALEALMYEIGNLGCSP